MGLTSEIKNITGVLTVQIEGFFTERYINLCKINNVKIWDIRNIVKGIVRFKINIVDFKKLRPIARKTKCKVSIKEKKGLYFKFFKYRKRKLVIILAILLITFSIVFSTFIWQININGNTNISKDEIMQGLKDSGIYIGKSKISLNKKDVINSLRVQVEDIAWAGIDIDGTTVNIQIIEKKKLAKKDIVQDKVGDIVALKSGVIKKIVPENGTAKYKAGSYIEKGNIAIEGTMYSKFLEPRQVSAKGILKVKCEYEYKKEYKYDIVIKKYTGNKRYTIGIGINSRENMINYLNKNKKYDILKSSKNINLFGNEVSFDLYNCIEYVENNVRKGKDELMQEGTIDAKMHLDNVILPNILNANIVENATRYEDTKDGIIAITNYVIIEDVGEFVER
ncbi:MAG: sporulation protein YqfD [Clostridia bacterium]